MHLVIAFVFLASLARADTGLEAIRSLTDEAKIGTLKGERVCNDRLLKCLYWLHKATLSGSDPAALLDTALQGHSRPTMTREALLRNLTICERLGIWTPENLANMRRGKSPVVNRGPYAGEIAEVDHILPLALYPEYDREFWNLELMPRTLNRRKGDSMGPRQWALLDRVTGGTN